MATLINAEGTVSETFAIGGHDSALPRLKHFVDSGDGNAEKLQIVNSSNTLLKMQGATPTANDDFATKAYVDGAAGSGASHVNTITSGTLAHTDAGTPVSSTATVANNGYALRVYVNVQTQFDGTTPTLTIGWGSGTGTGTEISDGSGIDLTTQGTTIIELAPVSNGTGGDSVIDFELTIGGSPTQGNVFVIVETVDNPAT